MIKQPEHKLVLKFAMHAGEIMLRSGAETYRVEDTICRILQTKNYDTVETFVIPTGIFATINDDSIEMTTLLRRIKSRSNRLDKVALINELSRKYVRGEISTTDAIHELKQIDLEPPYPTPLTILATGGSAGFFSFMFGGNIMDFCGAAFIGLIVGFLQQFLGKKEITRYLIEFLCGFVIGTIVIILSVFLPKIHIDQVIIGSIMPLVPGVAFTNAIRDTIEEELLSGITRGVEALFIAISIAAGIGIGMGLLGTLLKGGI